MPVGRRVARAVRAGCSSATPDDPVLTALHRLAGELADVRAVLTSPRTAVRLVLTPDSVVLAEARRSLTALALYGYPVDAAVVNRLVPDGADPWRSARAAAERDVLRSARESFGDVPLLEVPHAVAEPVGVDALAELASRRLYRTHDPLEVGRARAGARRRAQRRGVRAACCGCRWQSATRSTWPGAATTSC